MLKLTSALYNLGEFLVPTSCKAHLVFTQVHLKYMQKCSQDLIHLQWFIVTVKWMRFRITMETNLHCALSLGIL